MNKFEIISDIIKKRRTVKPAKMNGKIIPDSQVKQLLQLADWAPTHKHTEPWRFIVYAGSKAKEFVQQHAELYRKSVPEEQFKKDKYEKILGNAVNLSHLIVCVMKRDEQERIPEIEEISAASAAVQNILLGAECGRPARLDAAVEGVREQRRGSTRPADAGPVPCGARRGSLRSHRDERARPALRRPLVQRGAVHRPEGRHPGRAPQGESHPVGTALPHARRRRRQPEGIRHRTGAPGKPHLRRAPAVSPGPQHDRAGRADQLLAVAGLAHLVTEHRNPGDDACGLPRRGDVGISACACIPEALRPENGYPNACLDRTGGSSIVDPMGDYVAGPVFDVETIVYGDIDPGVIAQSKSVHNVTGGYSRWDLFSLATRQESYAPVVAYGPAAQSAGSPADKAEERIAALERQIEALREELKREK